MPDGITRVILIRHAESRPSAEVPESEWPLSERGIAQARALVDVLATERIDVIASSPYLRAHETVRPLAASRGLPIALVPNLRERKLVPGHDPEWERHLVRAWQNFDYALPGCESGKMCQTRVRQALQTLAQAHVGQTVVAASHGNAIALFLNALDATFGFERWQAMKTPDLFAIRWCDSSFTNDRALGTT